MVASLNLLLAERVFRLYLFFIKKVGGTVSLKALSDRHIIARNKLFANMEMEIPNHFREKEVYNMRSKQQGS